MHVQNFLLPHAGAQATAKTEKAGRASCGPGGAGSRGSEEGLTTY